MMKRDFSVVLDTSALISILLGEDEARRMVQAGFLLTAPRGHIKKETTTCPDD